MSYLCLEELQVSLNLNLLDKTKILSDAGCRYVDHWFIVTDDGNCHLFDNDGNIDDIAKVKLLCVKPDIKKIIVPCNVRHIGPYTFYNCNRLTSVTIPSSVMSIGQYAFAGCSSLMSMKIPDSVKSIEDKAFSYCISLMNVTIGNGVKSIGECAFYNCRSLKNVTIGNNVTSIGSYTFFGCNSLTSVTIPDSVTSIEPFVFLYCSNLNEVVFKGKTFEEVQSMRNYPFGIEDQSMIQVE